VASGVTLGDVAQEGTADRAVHSAGVSRQYAQWRALCVNNGLIQIGPGGGQNVTYDTIRKDEWLRLFNLRTIQASYFMNGYYCYSSSIDGVFQAEHVPVRG
jgi:hypothetical protein